MAAHQDPPSLGFSRQEHWSGLPFPSPMHESEKRKLSCSVVSNSSRPRGLQPTRLLHPWDFPSKSTGVGCHCLLLNFSLNSNKTLEFLWIINKGNTIIICTGNNCDYNKNRNHGYFHITLKLLPIFQNVIFMSWLVIQFLDLFELMSQVTLAVKNPSAKAGDIKDAGSIPGLGISPRGGNDIQL